MQQTETYKLNKPESTDTFSVGPLNENADTLEVQLARLDGADAAETAARQALDQRVTALEVQKIFFGEVLGSNTDKTVDLGVTPKAVLLKDRMYGGYTLLAVGDKCTGGGNAGGDTLMKIVENGFYIYATPSGYFFYEGKHYNYIAFA